MSESTPSTPQVTPSIGRNEPCPCGSGKKYKRCHGVDAAPKVTAPSPSPNPLAGMANAPGGMPFDPSQLDPAMMSQFMSAMQRLPKGQLQRIQSIMQRAMAGKDVSREAAELERTLPPDFQALMAGMTGMAGMASGLQGGAATESSIDSMSADEAKKIVEKAVSEGKLTADQATELLGATHPGGEAASTEKTGKFGKLWRSIRGQN